MKCLWPTMDVFLTAPIAVVSNKELFAVRVAFFCVTYSHYNTNRKNYFKNHMQKKNEYMLHALRHIYVMWVFEFRAFRGNKLQYM
jgi:hypothetical protein